MRIVVNAGWITADANAYWQQLAEEMILRLAALHQQDTFIFLLPAVVEKKFPGNVIPVYNQAPANLLAIYITEKWKLPELLEKYNADVFLFAGNHFPLKKSFPSCMIVPGIISSFKVKKSSLTQTIIAAPAASVRQQIINQYNFSPEKICPFYYAAGEIFQPAGWDKRENIKQQFAEGKEYFLYHSVSLEEDLITIKAFSFLKKKWQSNMKLIITSRDNNQQQSKLAAALAAYRYKKDVQVLQNITIDNRALLTAAAYALLYPFVPDNFALSLLEALQCEVPVIAGGNEIVREISQDAALYFTPHNIEDFGDKLCRLYKEEPLRKNLTVQAAKRTKSFNWKFTTAALWKCILSAAGNS